MYGGRQRHAAGQENPDALLDRDLGILDLARREDEHIAQIEVVRRHVDGHERFRPLAAIYKKSKVLSPAMKQFLTILKDDKER